MLNSPYFLLARMASELGIVLIAECVALFFAIKWYSVSQLPGIRCFIVGAVCHILTSLAQIPWMITYAQFILDPVTNLKNFNGWPDEIMLIAQLINLVGHIAWFLGAFHLWHYSRTVRSKSPPVFTSP